MTQDLNAMSAPAEGAPITDTALPKNESKVKVFPTAGDYTTGADGDGIIFPTGLAMALALVAQGLAIIPCREKPGRTYRNKKGQSITPAAKSPYWHKGDLPNGKDNATTDAEQIKVWWTRWPGALAGIACAASGLVVVDIDRHTCDGFETWQLLVEANGALPQGPAQSTRGGGLHLVFRRPEGINVRGRTAALGPGVDLLVNGYFCTGEGYTWLDGRDFTTPLPDLPAWIVEAANRFERAYYAPHEQPASTPSDGTRPGDEYARTHSWQDILTPHGWKLVGSKGSVDYWQRPGKEHGVSATIGYNGQDTFFCFTTNGHPFESWHGYKKFTAYALLEHGGDFQAAARTAKLECASPSLPPEPEADFLPAPDLDALELSVEEEEELDVLPQLSDKWPPYMVYHGAIHATERLRDGTNYLKRLCYFIAQIDKEILRDDGQATVRQFVISGRHENGQPYPPARIDAKDFTAMGWVMDVWGARAIICAGSSAKDKLREAIQQLSKKVVTHTVYTHTGWRYLDGKWVYLTATGAVGLPGVPVTVELDGKKQGYSIPTSLGEVNLCEAIRASLRLLELAPKMVTYPLYAAMFLAPLAELDPIDFMLWIHGETGSMKSVLVACFLNHYGGRFTYKYLPEGWSSTWMALEKSAFTIKDAPLVIDDYAPQGSSQEAQDMRKAASKLIRNFGNQTPRNRLDSDTNERPGYPSRGMVISTAELLPPGGESNTGRTFMVRMGKLDVNGVKRPQVDMELLKQAQRDKYLLPYAMYGYLLWLSKHWDALRDEHAERFSAIRDRLATKAVHLRHSTSTARLLMGLQLALTYAQ